MPSSSIIVGVVRLAEESRVYGVGIVDCGEKQVVLASCRVMRVVGDVYCSWGFVNGTLMTCVVAGATAGTTHRAVSRA